MDDNLISFLEENVMPYLPAAIFMLAGIYLLVRFWIIIRKIRDKRLLKTVTSPKRGTSSERDLVLALLKQGVPSQTIFHDLYVKRPGGNYSQIDVVVATNAGIIVFEVKDYSGWIFGDGRYTQWTQILAYGKEKYRFYNPIIQNKKHIEDLRKLLQSCGRIRFFSVVVFYGNCELKEISFVPSGTYLVKSTRVHEVMDIIMNNNDPAQYTDKHKVVRLLKEAVQSGEDESIKTRHVENIKDMLGKHRIFD
ncbi:MAG: nuclease-related domain-containing protein [Bacteroidales bacterium]